ncbi:MAG: hypothetical protein WA738_08445 [Candidatus Angelobacter sp.]
MDADLKKRLKLTLIIFVAAVVLQAAYLIYSRRDTGAPAKKAEPTYSSNQDDYVTTRKIVPYDLASAKQEMVGKPAWVKNGNQTSYYRYDTAMHSVNLSRQAGLLPPIAKLQIEDVIVQKQPVSLKPGQIAVVQKQIMAVFEKAGEQGRYAASIGTNTGDDYTFTVNDVLLFDDPHELYKHWPPEIWSAIDQHQAKEGMSELQASFALGTNANADGEKPGDRSIEYDNAGKKVTMTFEKNKAVKIADGAAQK